MHTVSEPSILYFGTPVVLISTVNEDGSFNLAPISSVFWLGWRCMIGISALSKTTENILRSGECVLNLPSVKQVAAVNRLALTTGSNPVPASKKQKGYHYEPDKFGVARLTQIKSHKVEPPRVKECPVQMEAVYINQHKLAIDNEAQHGRIITIELRIVQVYLEEEILMDGCSDRVDPNKWRPLIMSFQRFYGLGDELHYSRLAEIQETLYSTPDLEKARMHMSDHSSRKCLPVS
jgi:flavin reductase (DIM6/NTAB) family NADH-FMN oxidoreductase RutF